MLFDVRRSGLFVALLSVVIVPHQQARQPVHIDRDRDDRCARVIAPPAHRPRLITFAVTRDTPGGGDDDPPDPTQHAASIDDAVRAALARDDELAPIWNVGVPQFVLDVTAAVHSLLERWLQGHELVIAEEIHSAELAMVVIRRWRIAWHGYEPIAQERAQLRDLLRWMRAEAERAQIPRHGMSRDTTRHLAGTAISDTTRCVTSEGDRLHRRRLIAENIRTARIARGLTQQQLGDLVGVDRRQVNRWEAALVEPIPHASAIARALDVTLADLYTETPTLEPLP